MASERWTVEFHDEFDAEFDVFYTRLIKKADARFDQHLKAISATTKRKGR